MSERTALRLVWVGTFLLTTVMAMSLNVLNASNEALALGTALVVVAGSTGIALVVRGDETPKR